MSVFHLKYRPVKFSDLDLADIASALKKFLSAKDIPQSFLFTGPKGAGKTSAARILARAVNCLELIDGEPCGKCENCDEISRGNSMDVIEMDAASNRGIEDIRSLKDKAYLLPSKLKRKVFIVDEVHMLTKDAFNALLKLIEEPPKHTVFVLCTTDPEKIPETVLSRLVRVDFRKGGKQELLNSLKKIIEGEGIEISSEALDFIVEKSDGSFRNLQRNFNEMCLQLGKKMSKDEVTKFYLNKTGSYSEEDFDKDLENGEIKLILEKLEKMANQGVDFPAFRLQFMDYLQKKLLAFYGIGKEVGGGLNLDKTELLINLLIKMSKIEKDVEIDQLPLELVVVEFLRQRGNVEINKKEIKEEKKEMKEVAVEEITLTGEKGVMGVEMIEEKWGNLLMTIKPVNHSIEAFLRASRPKLIKGNTLMLEVFYPFHKDRLEEIKNKKIVEDCINKVFGVCLNFECVLGKNKKEPLIIKNDTPIESINEQLLEKKDNKMDIYDVAKEIFG